MKTLSLAISAAALIALCGAAQAQTVSGGDPYAQGYAAGAAAKQQNSFSAYEDGLQAGQTKSQAFDSGYQTGLAAQQQQNSQQASSSQQAYNDGYQDRVTEENANQTFDRGWRAGAAAQRDLDSDYPN